MKKVMVPVAGPRGNIQARMVVFSFLKIVLGCICLLGQLQRERLPLWTLVMPMVMLAAGVGGFLVVSPNSNPKLRQPVLILNGVVVFLGACVMIVAITAYVLGVNVNILDALLLGVFGLAMVGVFLRSMILITKLPSNRLFAGPLYL